MGIEDILGSVFEAIDTAVIKTKCAIDDIGDAIIRNRNKKTFTCPNCGKEIEYDKNDKEPAILRYVFSKARLQALTCPHCEYMPFKWIM